MTTKPGVASFVNELPTANWGDIWLSLFGLAVVSAIFGFLVVKIYGSSLNLASNPGFSSLPPQTQKLFGQFVEQSAYLSFTSIITVPIGFLIGMAVLFVCAKIVGGTGSFLSQAYAFALFTVPLDVARAVLPVIPIIGPIVSFLLELYGIVLTVMALAASQRLTVGRAIGALLIGVVGIGLLICALFVVLFVLIASTVHPTTTP